VDRSLLGSPLVLAGASGGTYHTIVCPIVQVNRASVSVPQIAYIKIVTVGEEIPAFCRLTARDATGAMGIGYNGPWSYEAGAGWHLLTLYPPVVPKDYQPEAWAIQCTLLQAVGMQAPALIYSYWVTPTLQQ